MVYKFPIYVPLAVAVFGMALSALGVFLARKRVKKRYTGFVFAGAFLFLILMAPAMIADRVELDDEKIKQTTGFWFAPTVKGFTLAEVESIHIGTAPNRKDKPMVAWFVRGRDGSVTQVNPGDLWKLHSDDIVSRLKARGIRITQEEGLAF